jgi:hypothetical protein
MDTLRPILEAGRLWGEGSSRCALGGKEKVEPEALNKAHFRRDWSPGDQF